MLVLTRRKGEAIAIGDNIYIQVLSVKGGQVRIGVNAPREIAVNREECQDMGAIVRPQQQSPSTEI